MAEIYVDSDSIADFCKRNHIRKLALFGSVLREDFRADSDVDMLVEFQSGHAVGHIGLGTMEQELSELIGRKVDLRTPGELSPYFRDEVVRSAVIQYVEG